MDTNLVERDWTGLYARGWGSLLAPEAYAHPAKGARGLAKRIYEHALAMSWLKPGDVCLDPFGGIGGFAYHAMANGLHFVGVELERPFIDTGLGCDCTGISKADWVRFQGRWDKARYLGGRHWCPRCLAQARAVVEPLPQPSMFDPRLATASYERNSGRIPATEPHRYQGNIETWRAWGLPGSAVLLQGDSRRLCEVVAEAGGCISSPPYTAAGVGHDGGHPRLDATEDARRAAEGCYRRPAYGVTEGQLAALPTGNLDSVISSPPYAESLQAETPEQTERKQARIAKSKTLHDGRRLEKPSPGKAALGGGYSVNPANLGNLATGDLAAALADGCVSSPPFESQNACNDPEYQRDRLTPGGPLYGDYGSSDGQLGQEQGNTFWSAAKTILEQTYRCLRPGAVAIFVLKAFVRSGQLVDFPSQWRALCEAVGFTSLEWIRAWLIEDRGTQIDLWGEAHTKTVKRLSFFRRLYESKHPENAIDYEVVYCCRKPGGAGHGADCAVSSPPYSEMPIAGYDGDMVKQWRETGKTPRQRSGGKLPSEQYGTDARNLGNMRAGDDDWREAVEQSPRRQDDDTDS